MPSTNLNISVLGSGAWGTALAQLISKKSDVLIWVKEKKVNTQQTETQE